MIDVDAAVSALRAANPVPDPDSFQRFVVDGAAFLDATTKRSMDMKTELEPLTTEKAPTPLWRRAMPALVVAVVMILAAAAIILLTRSGEPDVVDTPQGIAELFIEGDAATAGELLATDAVIDHSVVATVEEYGAWLDWQAAIGIFETVTACSETPIGLAVEVSCTYIFGNAWSDTLGVGPFTGSSYDFVIADGRIQEMKNNFDPREYGPQANDVFRRWLRSNHETTSMIDDASANQAPILTAESIALWEQYTKEFVASLAGSGTP